MVFPNKEEDSFDETEATREFFLKLRQLTAQPPLSEEFYEGLRQRLTRIPSTTEGSAQEDEISTFPRSSTQLTQAKAGKRSNWWWRAAAISGGIASAALIVLVGAFLLHSVVTKFPSLSKYKNSFSVKNTGPIEAQNRKRLISEQLREIEGKNKKLYEALVATISNIDDSLKKSHDPGGDKLLIAIAPLIDQVTSKENRVELKDLNTPGINWRTALYTKDKGTSSEIIRITIFELNLVEEKNKSQ